MTIYKVIFIADESNEIDLSRFVELQAETPLSAMERCQEFLDGCAIGGNVPVVIAAIPKD